MRPDFVGLDGFDSPTLPPAVALAFRPFVVLAALAVASAFPLTAKAQRPDSARVGVSAPMPAAAGPTPDATPIARRNAKPGVQPPITPGRAFFYSLALPGLGQAALDRRYTGAGFFLVEAFSLALVYRSAEDLRLVKSFLGDSVPLTYKVDPSTGIAERNNNGDPVVATWRDRKSVV